MKRLICRGKTENGEWVKGYPHWSDKNQNWHIHDIDSHKTVNDVIEKSIGRYVGKIGDDDVFEGDIIKEVSAEIEYQTHRGDNIPCGIYTEPIGVDIEYNYFVVPVFNIDNLEYIANCFLYKPLFEEAELYGLFSLPVGVDTDELISEFCDELGVKVKSIDEILSIINEIKVVGNAFDNPELLELIE